MEPDVTPVPEGSTERAAGRPASRAIARRSIAVVTGIAVLTGGIALIPGVRGWASATYGTLTCGDGLERLPDADAEALGYLRDPVDSPLARAVTDGAAGDDLGTLHASLLTDLTRVSAVGDAIIAMGPSNTSPFGPTAVYPGGDPNSVWALRHGPFVGGTEDWLALTRDTGRGIEVIRVDSATGAELDCLAVPQPTRAAQGQYGEVLPDGRIVVGWHRQEEGEDDLEPFTTEVRVTRDDAVDVSITWEEKIGHLDVSGDLLLASAQWWRRDANQDQEMPVRAYSLADGSLAWERPLDPNRREIVLAVGLGPDGTDTLTGFTEGGQRPPDAPDLRLFEVALLDSEGQERWRVPLGDGAAPSDTIGGWSSAGTDRWRLVGDTLLVAQERPLTTLAVTAVAIADGTQVWTTELSDGERPGDEVWVREYKENDALVPSASADPQHEHSGFALAGTTMVVEEFVQLRTLDLTDGAMSTLPRGQDVMIGLIVGGERYTILDAAPSDGQPEPLGVVLKRE